MARKNAKTPRFQILAEEALARVAGGRSAEQQNASIKMEALGGKFPPGSAWNLFFAAASEA